jgi:hypothetical protein
MRESLTKKLTNLNKESLDHLVWKARDSGEFCSIRFPRKLLNAVIANERALSKGIISVTEYNDNRDQIEDGIYPWEASGWGCSCDSYD